MRARENLPSNKNCVPDGSQNMAREKDMDVGETKQYQCWIGTHPPEAEKLVRREQTSSFAVYTILLCILLPEVEPMLVSEGKPQYGKEFTVTVDRTQQGHRSEKKWANYSILVILPCRKCRQNV
eukprot:6354515-Amphidinium_carterae.1